MSRTPLVIISNGTKYVEDTTRKPVCDCGMGQACSFADGSVYVCLSKSGIPMAQHRYWPNEFCAQEVSDYLGEESVVRLLTRIRRIAAVEALLGALGKTVKEA